MPFPANRSIALVGMPASGKSTAGVLLAKLAARPFVDTDLLIQSREGLRLDRLLAREGREGFLRLEEQCLLDLQAQPPRVIATGGSAIYSERGMAHLARFAAIVHLALDPAELAHRIEDPAARAVVTRPGQSIAQLHAEREALYRRHADLTVNAAGSPDAWHLARRIWQALENTAPAEARD